MIKNIWHWRVFFTCIRRSSNSCSIFPGSFCKPIRSKRTNKLNLQINWNETRITRCRKGNRSTCWIKVRMYYQHSAMFRKLSVNRTFVDSKLSVLLVDMLDLSAYDDLLFSKTNEINDLMKKYLSIFYLFFIHTCSFNVLIGTLTLPVKFLIIIIIWMRQ